MCPHWLYMTLSLIKAFLHFIHCFSLLCWIFFSHLYIFFNFQRKWTQSRSLDSHVMTKETSFYAGQLPWYPLTVFLWLQSLEGKVSVPRLSDPHVNIQELFWGCLDYINLAEQSSSCLTCEDAQGLLVFQHLHILLLPVFLKFGSETLVLEVALINYSLYWVYGLSPSITNSITVTVAQYNIHNSLQLQIWSCY